MKWLISGIILGMKQPEILTKITNLDARSPEELRFDDLMDGTELLTADEALYASDLTETPPYGHRTDHVERYWEELYPAELGVIPVGDTVSLQN
jgi:hypothetical protein